MYFISTSITWLYIATWRKKVQCHLTNLNAVSKPYNTPLVLRTTDRIYHPTGKLFSLHCWPIYAVIKQMFNGRRRWTIPTELQTGIAREGVSSRWGIPLFSTKGRCSTWCGGGSWLWTTWHTLNSLESSIMSEEFVYVSLTRDFRLKKKCNRRNLQFLFISTILQRDHLKHEGGCNWTRKFISNSHYFLYFWSNI